MPEKIFLTEREPLVFKAARWLAARAGSRPLDLSRHVVAVPTAGAARRLRAELTRCAAGAGTGLLPPRLTTPMGLLGLETRDNPASRADSLLAWSSVIAHAPEEKFPFLFPGFSDVSRQAFSIAQTLREICATLAEGGLTPSSPEIARACAQDEDRWREMETLYRRYLQALEKAGLSDPDVLRIQAATRTAAPPGIEHIILAGVPDVNPLVARYLAAVLVPVTILVDAVECDGIAFDSWGRPDPAHWCARVLPPVDALPLADLASEAGAAARLLGHAGLCVADSALLPHLQRAFAEHGREAFDPAGLPLSRFECAAICRRWVVFCQTGKIDDLRALLEQPVFLRAFCDACGFPPALVFQILDELATKHLLATTADAAAWLRERGGEAAKITSIAESWRKKFRTTDSLAPLPDFLEKIYSGHRVSPHSGEAGALAALGGVLRGMLGSPLRGADEQLLAAEIQAAAIYDSHGEQAVELNGWLEAPWMPHDALLVCGCTEGALPSQITGHPFLPDSLRSALGLPDNAQRFARDVCLLHNLLASRGPGRVKLTLSRTGAEGEPARPSRLLLRCDDGELPARVRRLFGAAPSLKASHARRPAWQLEVPQRPPPAKLSATAFGDYLGCPLRFYFKRVLGMEGHDPLKAEMDALDFGNMLHLAIEDFSRDTGVRDTTSPEKIEKHVFGALDTVLAAQFGTRLSLPVRVQRESLRARLRQFARIQAREAAAGWRIVDAEIPFKTEDTLTLGGIAITGKIDRVEVHQKTGRRRVLDYKTYKSVKNHHPSETHLGPARGEPDLPEAEFDHEGKPRRWRQLQLPLYRALAAFRWPDDPAPALTAYFLLPEKLEESEVFEFDLNDGLFDSAMQCAMAVADRVRRGVFWPPREPDYEEFEEIFLGQDPATVLSAESIVFLKGDHASP